METKKIKCWDISHRQDVIRDIDETGVTLCARMGTGGNNIPIVLMDQGGGVMSVEVNKTGTLRAQTHGHEPVVIHKAEAYRISAEKSNAMLSDNPTSGIYKTELSPTLDTTIPTAQKAQGGLMVVNKEDIVLSNKQFTPHVATDGKGPTLISSNNSEPAVINVEKDDKTYMLAENVIGRTDKNGPGGKGWTADVSFTLNATGVPAVCEKTDFINMTTDDKSCVPVSTMLATRGDRGSQENGLGVGNEGDPSYTLTKAHEHAVSFDGCVRRLLPVECERLMGFPDEYTKIPYKGKPADQCPDGPRYKALGNSWAVPVVAWLGKRIDRAMRGLPVQNAVKQTPPPKRPVIGTLHCGGLNSQLTNAAVDTGWLQITKNDPQTP